MAEDYSILVAIHSQIHKGQEVLGDKWMNFFYTLRNLLLKNGLEDPESGVDLLLFTYSHPYSAFSSVFESLHQTKEEFEWEDSFGAAPLQIIFHLEKQGDLPAPLREASSNLWNLLREETPYVTRSLKLQWEVLMKEKSLPPHHFESEEMGLFRVEFLDKSLIRKEKLFPHRSLSRKGDLKECFYCGKTNHKPSFCPSKLLTMETQALSEIGYHPIALVSENFKEAFSQQEKNLNILAAGVTSSQIRKDLNLQVFIAYFDVFRVYQPRFLWNVAFASLLSRWDELGNPEMFAVDSQNLHLGFDCLRVGQYEQAEEFFVDESRRPKGKQFCATIGRAFIALELERYSDMGHFLESANTVAHTDNEHIYISLLLSRYYEIEGDLWKAEQTGDNVFTVNRDCTDGLYRQIQLSVAKNGFGEKVLQRLRALVTGKKEFFMVALMDPLLLPISGPVEDMLSSRIRTLLYEAEENLIQARIQCEELRSWLDEDDLQMRTYTDDLAELERKFERQSYFDTIDVAERSKNMVSACYRIQEAKLDELCDEVKNAVFRWEGYRNFWRTYTYQPLFKGFYTTLMEIREKLSVVRPLAEKNQGGEVYRKAVGLLEDVENRLDSLRPLIAKMNWLKITFDSIKLFGKKLVIAEVSLLTLLLVLVPVLSVLLSDTVATGTLDLLKNPLFQKQALFIFTIFIAPLVALAQTLWKIMET